MGMWEEGVKTVLLYQSNSKINADVRFLLVVFEDYNYCLILIRVNICSQFHTQLSHLYYHGYRPERHCWREIDVLDQYLNCAYIF